MIFDQTDPNNWFWCSRTTVVWWVRDTEKTCRMYYHSYLCREEWTYGNGAYKYWAQDSRGAPITTLLQLLITGPI